MCRLFGLGRRRIGVLCPSLYFGFFWVFGFFGEGFGMCLGLDFWGGSVGWGVGWGVGEGWMWVVSGEEIGIYFYTLYTHTLYSYTHTNIPLPYPKWSVR